MLCNGHLVWLDTCLVGLEGHGVCAVKELIGDVISLYLAGLQVEEVGREKVVESLLGALSLLSPLHRSHPGMFTKSVCFDSLKL